MTVKTAVAMAAAAMFGSAVAGPISGFTIEFEGSAGNNFNGGSSFTENGIIMTAVDPYGSGLVGAGVSPGTCDYGICPSRASTYYAVLNDGSLKLEGNGGNLFGLSGFDAGFIAPAFDFSLIGMIGEIVVTGQTAAGQAVARFELQGLLDNGTSGFARFDFDDAFSSLRFSSVDFSACLFDWDGSCTPGASFNLGQIGLDSIQVIPEPSSYALAGLALAAALGARRRRRA